MASKEAQERKRLEEVKRGHDLLESLVTEVRLLRQVIEKVAKAVIAMYDWLTKLNDYTPLERYGAEAD